MTFLHLNLEAKDNVCVQYLRFNEQLQCTSKDYFLKFGHPYCLKFIEAESKFSSDGLVVLERIRNCLITQMNSHMKEITCKSAFDVAMRDHEICYIRSGFCRMKLQDKLEIANIIKKELFSPRMQSSMAKIALSCGAPRRTTTLD